MIKENLLVYPEEILVTNKLCSTVSEPENPFKMATGDISSSMFSVRNFTDDLTKDAIDEDTSGEGDWLGKTRKTMTINLKAALKACQCKTEKGE